MPATKLNRSQYVRVPIEDLKTGIMLRSPLYDDNEESPVLLIAAGKQLTPQQLEKIRGRQVTHVLVGRGDLDRTNKDASRRAKFKEEQEKRAKEESARSKWSNGRQPFMTMEAKTATNPAQSKMAREFGDSYESTIANIGDIYVELSDGVEISGAMVMEMASECLRQISEDVDLFVTLGMAPDVTKYPVSHSLQVARLAMSMGAVIGMDQDSLMQLGTGCLLHDVGMIHVDPEILNAQRPLDPVEMLEIHRHPIRSAEIVEKIDGLPLGARMVAHQMHERLDGSGYPRGRGSISIHPFAKVAMVADVFVAMTSPRPHRPAIWPYFAVVEILEQSNAGLLDKDCVRALLETVSMFPLGSFVELTDGRRGTVVRANPGEYSRPIVDVSTLDEPDVIVDLKKDTSVSIAHPLGQL